MIKAEFQISGKRMDYSMIFNDNRKNIQMEENKIRCSPHSKYSDKFHIT